MERVVGFDMHFIERNTVYRTYLATLRRIKMSDTFRAFGVVNLIYFNALIDRAVRTLRLADVTVDTLVGNF